MDKIQLKAQTRENKGLTPAKLRKLGLLPAILYGHKVKNQNLSVDFREFEKTLKKAGESTIVDLITPDGKNHPVLIHEVQYHYLNSQPIHADFYEVSMTQKLKAKVVLEFIGESKAVKQLGGVLVKVLNEVEVECLPADLPHNFQIDISCLEDMQATLHVKDLKSNNKIKILTPGDELIAKIQPPRDIEAELATPVVEDVSKVEGAAEEKPAAEGEAKAGDKVVKEENPAKSAAPAGGKEEKK